MSGFGRKKPAEARTEAEPALNPPFVNGETSGELDKCEKDKILLREHLEQLQKIERIPNEKIEGMIKALHADLQALQKPKEYADLTKKEYKLISEVMILLEERLGKEWLVQLEVIDSLPNLRPLDVELRNSKVEARYCEISGFIEISTSVFQASLPHNILKQLALAGYCEGLGIVHHEGIHSGQYYMPEIERYKLRQYDRASEDEKQKLDIILHERLILREAHAYTGEEVYFSDAKQLTIEKFISILKETGETLEERHLSNLILTPKDIYQLGIAVDEVKCLYALGALDKEIGECVREAQWVDVEGSDGTDGYYDTMVELLKERMKEAGLEYPKDLDIVHSLVELKDLERQIYIEQVQIAAQEVLKKAYEKFEGSIDSRIRLE